MSGPLHWILFMLAGTLLAILIVGCFSVSTMPAPGRLGDEGWRIMMYRPGIGPDRGRTP